MVVFLVVGRIVVVIVVFVQYEYVQQWIVVEGMVDVERIGVVDVEGIVFEYGLVCVGGQYVDVVFVVVFFGGIDYLVGILVVVDFVVILLYQEGYFGGEVVFVGVQYVVGEVVVVVVQCLCNFGFGFCYYVVLQCFVFQFYFGLDGIIGIDLVV